MPGDIPPPGAIISCMLWIATIALGVATLITALIAAFYWYKSSVISAQEFDWPNPSYDEGLSLQVIIAELNIGGIRLAMSESCRLNMWAARWTGLAAILGAATTFAGMFH
jgi:hypothetical protein